MAFYKALATLIGMIIGVGTFGLPHAFLKSGIMLGILYLFLVFFVVLLNHLFFGEIILRTNEDHRFIGYLRKYLGTPYALLGLGSLIFALLGSLLAYLIIGGQFLRNIFDGILNLSEFQWSILFWLIFSFLILRGTKLVAKGELFLNAFLIASVLIIFIIGVSNINISNLADNFIIKDAKDFFFPYGVILFALSGGAAIPELRRILQHDGKIKKVIILGTLVPAILYLIFALFVIGIVGQNVSEDIFSGLNLGKPVVILGSIFGFLVVATSFIVLGLYFKHTLSYDYNVNKIITATIVLFAPLLLFLTISWNFVTLIGFIGAIFGSIDGILMILLYRKAKILGERTPEYSLKISNFTLGILVALFLFAIIHQIIYAV